MAAISNRCPLYHSFELIITRPLPQWRGPWWFSDKKRAPSMGEYLNSGLITVGRDLQKTNTDEMVRQALADYQPDRGYRYAAGTGEIIKIIG